MESEIINLEEELRKAMLSNDVETLDRLIEDSLIFILPDGAKATKQMDLAAHKDKIQKMSELNLVERQIKMHDNLAIVIAKMAIKGAFGDSDISGLYSYLRVWSRINGNWKIVAGSLSIVD